MKFKTCIAFFAYTVCTTFALASDKLPVEFSPKQSIDNGVNYFTGRAEDPQWNIFVAEIDMNDPSLHIEPIAPPDVVRAATTTIAKKNNAIAAVNSSFFNMKTGEPYGYFRRDGKTERTNTDTPFGVLGFTWGKERKPVIANITKEETPVKPNKNWNLDKVETAVASGPVLVVDGRIDISPEYSEIAGRNPRTAVGFNRDTNRFYMVVVDGRTTDSVGMTFKELAQLLIDVGCTDALNCDGGGSSALALHGKLMNKPVGKTEQRPVPLCWGVTRTVIIDNDMTAPNFTFTGTWQDVRTTNGTCYANSILLANGASAAAATFKTTLPKDGTYKVFTRWNSMDKPAASAVRYTIDTADGEKVVKRDQTLAKGDWHKLGTYTFTVAKPAQVTVDNSGAPQDRYVSADAVKFVYVIPANNAEKKVATSGRK